PRPTEPAPTSVAPAAGSGADPLLDELLADDPGATPTGLAQAAPPMAAPMPPTIPAIPAMPPFGGGAGVPAGAPVGSGLIPAPSLDSAPVSDPIPPPVEDSAQDQPEPDADEPAADEPVAEETEATSDAESVLVHLPDGDTIAAPSPELAAAITAAVAGTPVAEAYHQQGITIPPPGTPVAHPVESARLTAGDVGMLTDRHAVALGNGKAVFNGKIEPISSVTGPSFLGWEHPPEPGSTTAPPKSDRPTPTRPAVTAGPS
ncbi:MAG TPA: hypothetical protein VMD51_00040, partial [Mycobacterium sp.]|nr:hypothetical protein [Mycobacterium sp.]